MEELNQDTPQQANTNSTNEAFEWPTPEGSTDTNLPVKDAFFGKSEDSDPVAPEEGQPTETSQETVPQQDQASEAKNDERRFEYWQSQAAKRENEIKELQNKMETSNGMQETQSTPAPAEPESFPSAPDRPQKPRGFSRDEAWSDPSSESARYLDDVDTWNDDMGEYNTLRHQYDLALMQERLDGYDNQRKQEDAKRDAYRQQQSQQKDIYDHVTGHYGFSTGEASDFIQTMSSPDSISMENLVQLYRMQKGGGSAPASPQPSDDFQQAQRAQQIPSPMGVMPSQTDNNQGDESNQIMDRMISDFKGKNPWT